LRESYIEQKVTEYAQKQGWLEYKWASPSHRGVPDRQYFKAGVVIMIEFKAPGKRPTKLQQSVHQELAAEGFPVHVIDSIDAGKQLFTQATQ
jgi:hypothetical protein